jgi:hypothetical protein
MKLTEIKLLKNDELFARLLTELKVKGLNNVYIKRDEEIDYFDVAISIIDFLQDNKEIFKNLTQENYEKLVVICLDEALEEIGIIGEVEEKHIERVLKLLKNNLLVQEFSGKIWDILVLLYNTHLKKYVDILYSKVKKE